MLALLGHGLGTQEVADQLGISKNTRRGDVKTSLRKLDAHTQLEAVAIARRLGSHRSLTPGDRCPPAGGTG